jgi:hypothetical protein
MVQQGKVFELTRRGRDGERLWASTLAELVETYLAQHDVQPVTIEKLSASALKTKAMSSGAPSGPRSRNATSTATAASSERAADAALAT